LASCFWRRARRHRRVAVPETSGERRITERAQCDPWIDSGDNGKLADILFFPPMKKNPNARDRSHLLSWLMLPVALRLVFLRRAGALGSAALLSLTSLEPAQVVGTDIAFGLSSRSSAAARIGSRAPPIRIYWFTSLRRHRRSHFGNHPQYPYSTPSVALCALGLAACTRRQLLFNGYEDGHFRTSRQ